MMYAGVQERGGPAPLYRCVLIKIICIVLYYNILYYISAFENLVARLF